MRRRDFLSRSWTVGVFAVFGFFGMQMLKKSVLEVQIYLPKDMTLGMYEEAKSTWLDLNEYHQVANSYSASARLNGPVETTYDLTTNTLVHKYYFDSEDSARDFCAEMVTRCRFNYGARRSYGIKAARFLNNAPLG